MKALNLCLFVLMLAGQRGFGRDGADSAIRLSRIPPGGLLLDKGWRFHAGDSAGWSNARYNDHDWQPFDPAVDIRHIPFFNTGNICWFRLQLIVDSSLMNRPLGILLSQVGASEIYLNGALIYTFGKVGRSPHEETTHFLLDKPFSIQLGGARIQTLAVRYSYERRGLLVHYMHPNYCLHAVLNTVAATFGTYQHHVNLNFFYELSQASMWLLLGVMSLTLFFSLRERNAYLYVAVFSTGGFLGGVLGALIAPDVTSTAWNAWLIFISRVVSMVSIMAAMRAFLELFDQRKDRYYYVLNVLTIAGLGSFFFVYDQADNILLLVMLAYVSEYVRRTWPEMRRRRPGALILFLCQIIFFTAFAAAMIFKNIGWFAGYRLSGTIGVINIPFCWTIFLAGEYVRARHALQVRVAEVEMLNDTLERKVIQRTAHFDEAMKSLQATQTRELMLEKQLALQAERQRISADLHDDIGSTLSSVNIYAGLARKADDKEMYLESISRNVSEVVAKLDDLVWSINSRLDTLGYIMERILAAAEPTTRVAGITLNIRIDGELREMAPPSEVKHHLYMVVRECVTNAIKHARCQTIDVRIAAINGDLHVTVADDGRGFSEPQQAKGRNGLANMRQRAAEVKGSIAIRTAPDAGTEIHLVIPFSAAPENGHSVLSADRKE